MGLVLSASRLIIAFIAITAVSAFHFTRGNGEDPIPAAGLEGWISLFEGESLRGWEQGSGDWIVSKGRMRGSRGTLLNRWCWADFELKVHYRGDGCLLFRVGSDDTGHIGFGQPGFQIDLGRIQLRPAETETASSEAIRLDTGTEHRLELVVRGSSFMLSVDGRGPVHYSGKTSPFKGRIGFRGEGENLEVFSVRVRSLELAEAGDIPSENDYCFVCHYNFEYDDSLVEVHAESDIGCSACHGPSLKHRSDEDNVIPPDVMYRRPQIDRKCRECHEPHEPREFPGEGKPVPDLVCTDCHGDHQLPGR